MFSAPVIQRGVDLGNLSSFNQLSADVAHPNGKGAALLAELATTLITTRLRDTEACSGVDTAFKRSEDASSALQESPPF